jgi:hypothetical protein
VVSSLPFLAPIFLRKAKQYTSKYSGSGNNYGSGARKIKSGDAYKLSSLSSSQRKGTFATTIQGQSTGSEENILKASPENSIMKSVTYSVRVDRDE